MAPHLHRQSGLLFHFPEYGRAEIFAPLHSTPRGVPEFFRTRTPQKQPFLARRAALPARYHADDRETPIGSFGICRRTGSFDHALKA